MNKKEAHKYLADQLTAMENTYKRIGTSTIRFLDMRHQKEYDKLSRFRDVVGEMTKKEWQDVEKRLQRRENALKNENTIF